MEAADFLEARRAGPNQASQLFWAGLLGNHSSEYHYSCTMTALLATTALLFKCPVSWFRGPNKARTRPNPSEPNCNELSTNNGARGVVSSLRPLPWLQIIRWR